MAAKKVSSDSSLSFVGAPAKARPFLFSFRRRLTASAAVVLSAVAAGLMGCQSSGGRRGSDVVPQLTAEAASAARLSAQEVSDANALYTIKCAKCHKFYHPADYSQTDWDSWMRKMSRKSKLKPAQEELLTRYFAAFRERRP